MVDAANAFLMSSLAQPMIAPNSSVTVPTMTTASCAVGARSKLVAYGNNRADYSFIPGGMVPGVVIVQPDFPELKEDWPFLWFENEYVVGSTTSFIVVANAAEALTR